MNWQDCGPGDDGGVEVDGDDHDEDGDDENGDVEVDGDDRDGGENLMSCTDTASIISCALSTHGRKVQRAGDKFLVKC